MSDSNQAGQTQHPTQGQAQNIWEIALSGAIALVKDGKNYDQASSQLEAIAAQVAAESPEAGQLLKQLWKEYVSVQRSAVFYESLSEAEAGLSEKMAESTIQLKRNYMRLIQEQ